MNFKLDSQLPEEKFASSWLVAIFGANPDQHGTKIHENILLLTDYAELLKYLSAADVHVASRRGGRRVFFPIGERERNPSSPEPTRCE